MRRNGHDILIVLASAAVLAVPFGRADDAVVTAADTQLAVVSSPWNDAGGLAAESSALAPDNDIKAVSFSRAGYVANMPLGSDGAKGVATILDDTHIQVEHFSYNGAAPAVYFDLGVENSYPAFLSGLLIPPRLDRAYTDETVLLTLPSGTSVDGYFAISVWCEEFHVNFTSATFMNPNRGDLNCDNVIDNFDIDPFVMALTSATHEPPFDTYDAAYPGCDGRNADIDGDGEVNLFDVDPFVALLRGG